MRTQNIAVIQVGSYTKLAFEDRDAAMQLMNILGQAVQVTDSTWDLNKLEQPHTWFLDTGDFCPELKFVPSHLFNTEETVKEAKTRLEREAKDREDLEQQMRQHAEPALLAQAAPSEPTAEAEEAVPSGEDSNTGATVRAESDDDFPF